MRVALLYLLTFLFTLPLFGQWPGNFQRWGNFLYSKEGNEITIAGYQQSGVNHDVTVPATIEGLPVTKIGRRAFERNYYITGIHLPDTLVSIEESAFYSCSRITSITLPDSVTTIGDSAFYSCSGLTSIHFSNNLTTIGNYAFNGCRGLTSITLPDTLTSIGLSAFGSCLYLTHITFPSSLNSLGQGAFRSNFSLKTATFLGNAPATTAANVFSNMRPDFTIYYLSDKTGFTTPEWLGQPALPIDFTYTISSGSVTINKYTGPGGAVIIPSTVEGIPVTHIAHEAFRSKETITSLTLPDSITSIGSGAFDGCHSLASIIIPASVTSIQDAAFRNTGLSSALFLGNVPTTFGDAVFTDTPSGFTIYYYGSSTGFTSPLWQGHPAVDLVSYNPLHTWRMTHFDTPDNTGSAANTADPDSDGLSNLLEYAFNLNPLARGNTTLNPGRGSRGLPIVTIDPQPDSHPTIRVEYIRRKGTGIRYTPQYSNDLQENSWSTIEGTETVTSINASWERVIIADAPSNPPRHFCRVKVEEVPN